MATLFQLYSNLDSLESTSKQLAQLWQMDDSILLLGETGAFYPLFIKFFTSYCTEYSQKFCSQDHLICYVLQQDISTINTDFLTHVSTMSDDDTRDISYVNYVDNVNKTSNIIVITDEQWVTLIQKFDKVVTVST